MTSVPQRREKPLRSETQSDPISTERTISFIKYVVSNMKKPTWMNSVPRDFGDVKTGTLKADEWRSFTTLYLPVALTMLWGEGSRHVSPDITLSLRTTLDHNMQLVQAVILASYRSTDRNRIHLYRQYMGTYLHGLRSYFDCIRSTVQHMSCHIHNFLELLRPVHSWWTFPFERMIGHLQRLPSNNKFGRSLLGLD